MRGATAHTVYSIRELYMIQYSAAAVCIWFQYLLPYLLPSLSKISTIKIQSSTGMIYIYLAVQYVLVWKKSLKFKLITYLICRCGYPSFVESDHHQRGVDPKAKLPGRPGKAEFELRGTGLRPTPLLQNGVIAALYMNTAVLYTLA